MYFLHSYQINRLSLQQIEDINGQIQKYREDIAIEIAVETKNNNDDSIYWNVHEIKDRCVHFKRIYDISQTDNSNIIIDINELKVVFHKQNDLHQFIYDISDAYHFNNHRGGSVKCLTESHLGSVKYCYALIIIDIIYYFVFFFLFCASISNWTTISYYYICQLGVICLYIDAVNYANQMKNEILYHGINNMINML